MGHASHAVRFKTGAALARVYEHKTCLTVLSSSHRVSASTKPILKLDGRTKDAGASQKSSAGGSEAEESEGTITEDALPHTPRQVRFRRATKICWTWSKGRRFRQIYRRKSRMQVRRDIEYEDANGLLEWTDEDEVCWDNTVANAGEEEQELWATPVGRITPPSSDAEMDEEEVWATGSIDDGEGFVSDFEPISSPTEGYIDEDGFMCYDCGLGEEVEADADAEEILDMYRDDESDEGLGKADVDDELDEDENLTDNNQGYDPEPGAEGGNSGAKDEGESDGASGYLDLVYFCPNWKEISDNTDDIRMRSKVHALRVRYVGEEGEIADDLVDDDSEEDDDSHDATAVCEEGTRSIAEGQ